jgi:hypothetical protein
MATVLKHLCERSTDYHNRVSAVYTSGRIATAIRPSERRLIIAWLLQVKHEDYDDMAIAESDLVYQATIRLFDAVCARFVIKREDYQRAAIACLSLCEKYFIDADEWGKGSHFIRQLRLPRLAANAYTYKSIAEAEWAIFTEFDGRIIFPTVHECMNMMLGDHHTEMIHHADNFVAALLAHPATHFFTTVDLAIAAVYAVGYKCYRLTPAIVAFVNEAIARQPPDVICFYTPPMLMDDDG